MKPVLSELVCLAVACFLSACGIQESKTSSDDPMASNAPINSDGLPTPDPAPAPQIARFTVWLDILDKDLIGFPVQEVADRLVANSARASTFNIQALGRLYANQNPLFVTVREKFKSLEDSIGDYQKWVDLEKEGETAGSSEAVMARLKAKREKARIVLEKALVTTGFVPANPESVPYIQELRFALDSYPWKDAVTDRNEMLKKLIAELEVIKSTRYDFKFLEAANGVHEFRRKMRWFSMESRALNGMVSLKPKNTTCPVPSYANVIYDFIAKTKYAVLPESPTEPNPITLTPCLYVKVAKLIDDVNLIKAKAEKQDSLAEGEPKDLVDPKDQLKVQGMLDDSLSNNLFGLLQDELASGLVIIEQPLPVPAPINPL